jgi:hypothetical protein
MFIRSPQNLLGNELGICPIIAIDLISCITLLSFTISILCLPQKSNNSSFVSVFNLILLPPFFLLLYVDLVYDCLVGVYRVIWVSFMSPNSVLMGFSLILRAFFRLKVLFEQWLLQHFKQAYLP